MTGSALRPGDQLDNHALATEGYSTVRVLDSATILRLSSWCEAANEGRADPFFATAISADRESAIRIDREIRADLAESLARVIPGYESFLGSFITKRGGNLGAVEFHQDLTYADERVARTLLVWIPLVDVTADNGALSVVPGSHRWADGIRPGGPVPLATSSMQTDLADRAVCLPVPAGTAVVLDNALIHGSGPNRTGSDRPVVALDLAPAGSKLVHFWRASAEEPVVGFQIRGDYFVEQEFHSRPEGYPSIPAWTRPVTAVDLAAGMRRSEALSAVPAPSHRGLRTRFASRLRTGRRS